MGEESVGRVAIYSLLPTDLPTVLIPSVTPSAKPSVILTGNRHVTIRTCYSNPSVIPSVFLTVHRSRHRYGSGISNMSVIPSVFLTVNRSHHAYGPQSVITDRITDEYFPSVISAEKYRQKKFRREFLVVEMGMAKNSTSIIPVNVGVVLDLDNDLDSKIGLSCINMSLSDFYDTHGDYKTFYDTHGDYKTRLVLITRDSKNDVAGAAAAGSPSLPPLS
ncbi:hypothetical protein NC651_037976 [Populus alba x Populus x berolinensis]|nr:hypothetical protein NC651_037976 [Populus alba x Populus x berolinensis]